MKLFNRTIFSFLSLGIIVLLLVSFVFYFQFKEALIERTLEQLSSVNMLKKTAIEEELKKGGIPQGQVPGYIQQILSQRTGLGATGESYIVGGDFRMRSRSRFYPDKNPLDIKVETEGVKNALEGKEGKTIISDYRGVSVLSTYRKVQGADWVILSEIDENEVVVPVEEMKSRMFITAALIFALIFIISLVISRKMDMLAQQGKAALLQGQEEERIRLSKDIHDGAGPLLTSIKLQLSDLHIEEEKKVRLKQLIDETIAEMRRISHNLMPSVLLDFGVGSAIKNLVELLSKSSDSRIVYVDDILKSNSKLSKEINVALYRIAQEALNNAIKYAAAHNIKISITEFPDKVSLFVSDDGSGFSAENVGDGKGLQNMRERVRLLNGEIFINSDKDGTVIEVEIPLI
ncbi:MAG: ATP-binding protein [Flavobacteriales bacterium]